MDAIKRTRKRVVVVGGGFGGVYAAKGLLKKGYAVTLLNERNYFTFTPLLHEVATGSLINDDIIFEFETFFHHKQFDYVRGRASGIDTEAKRVHVGAEIIDYDMLVIATGSRAKQAIISGCDEHALPLKRADDARRIKQAVIEGIQGPDRRMHINIIGGGPTGVELALDLEPFLDRLIERTPDASGFIRLIHATSTLGGSSDERLQTYIRRAFAESRVEVKTDCTAQNVTATKVETTCGTFDSDLTILTVGVEPNTKWIGKALPLTKNGHVLVGADLRVHGKNNVFALGDVAQGENVDYPDLAQVAVRQARTVVENIDHTQKGAPLKAFELRLSGYLVSLGVGRGVGVVFDRVISGLFAWWVWRLVYLFKTPGPVNKLRVAFSWALHLFTGRNLSER